MLTHVDVLSWLIYLQKLVDAESYAMERAFSVFADTLPIGKTQLVF